MNSVEYIYDQTAHMLLLNIMSHQSFDGLHNTQGNMYYTDTSVHTYIGIGNTLRKQVRNNELLQHNLRNKPT